MRTIAGGRLTNSRKLPPGPAPFPVIGNLHQLGDKPHQSLAELAKTYGPILSLKQGQLTTVVISSPTLAKEILQKQDLAFSNRSVRDALRACDHHKNAIPWLPVSAQWRTLRKICNSHVFSAQKLDGNRHLRRHKVDELLSEVRRSCDAGVPVEIFHVTFKTSLNLLSSTFFSMDWASTESDITGELKETVTQIFEDIGKFNLVDYFPVLAGFDPQGIRRRMAVNFRKMYEMFEVTINQRLEAKRLNRYIPSNDVLDTLLSISEDDEGFDRAHVKILLLDLFTAGTDTTSSTLEWTMTELFRNPKILLKAQEELQQVIGRGNPIEESDIIRLPYLNAIIKENFRLHPPAPLLLPRRVEADAEVSGFTVPRGAQVLVNVWAIGRDPCTWERPNEFMPERFLGSEVDVRGRDFELLPFGGGRRICPGLPLAQRMVHLMLASLLNSFDWRLENGVLPENLGVEEVFGLTLRKANPLKLIPISL
ncbi:Geraniol 8-hydroxylase [Bertholletia excelsa]